MGELHTRIACSNAGSMHISCAQGTIVIIDGYYGRLRPDWEVCPYGRDHNDATDCVSENSLQRMRDQCEGEASCSLPVNSGGTGDPCPGTYKYLEASYRCQWCTSEAQVP